MSVRALRFIGDPVLRTPSDKVVRFDDALAQLVADLLDTVQVPGRAGLAANQIGSGLAVFSYNVDGQLGYVINPVRGGDQRRAVRRRGLPVHSGRQRRPDSGRLRRRHRRRS